MWSTRHFFNLQSDGIAYTNNYGRNGHILQYKMFGEYCHWTFCTFKDKLIFVRYMKQSLTLVFGTVFIGWNQLQIFDNDNFSIIPKSIFSDNDSLPISCKNADLSAVNNFFRYYRPPLTTTPGESITALCLKNVIQCHPRDRSNLFDIDQILHFG